MAGLSSEKDTKYRAEFFQRPRTLLSSFLLFDSLLFISLSSCLSSSTLFTIELFTFSLLPRATTTVLDRLAPIARIILYSKLNRILLTRAHRRAEGKGDDRPRYTYVSNYERIIVGRGSTRCRGRTIIISALAIIIAGMAINSCRSGN